MRVTHPIIVALVLAVALPAVACGGAPAGTAGPLSLTLVADVVTPDEGSPTQVGFALESEDVTSPGPTIRARVGQSVTITLKNMEDFVREPHDFVVVAEKDRLADRLWESQTDLVFLGDEQTITFTPDAPGTYYYVCSISDHFSRGMWGTFVVES